MSAAQQWYYRGDGAQQGPVSTAELKQLATAGKLRPTDLIWREGMAKWVPAGQTRGLFAPNGSQAATAPPVATAPPPAAGVRVVPPEMIQVVAVQPMPPIVPGAPAAGGGLKVVWQRLGTPARAGVIAGGALGLLLVLLVPILLLSGKSGSASGVAGTSGSIPVRDLLRDFLQDRQGAEKKYLGQTVTLRGVITEVMNEHHGTPRNGDGNVVQLETGSVRGEVLCTFSLKHARRLMELGKGKEIAFTGRCSKYHTGKWQEGKAGFLEFDDCELVEGGGEQVAGGKKDRGNSSTPTGNLKAGDFAERLRKLTGVRKSPSISFDGNQAANMFERRNPLSPKWRKHGTFTLYSIASNTEFRAGDAFQAVGRPDQVSQAAWPSTWRDPPGKDWQEWVWFRNGVGFRCHVMNLSARKEGREDIEVREDDRVILAAPGLLVGGGRDF